MRMWVVALKPGEVPGFSKKKPALHRLADGEAAWFDRLARELSRCGEDVILNAGLRYFYLQILRSEEETLKADDLSRKPA